MPVSTQHPTYRKMVGRWKRCRDVADGQDAVHVAGEEYLPKLVDQTATEYSAYKGRATFYNATWRTIAGYVGMLFRQPPQVDVTSDVEKMLDDVTMSGVTFQHFAEECCEEALKCGRLGVLVDYPSAPVAGRTLADERAANLRPTMQIYRAESIINWRTEKKGNYIALTMVVLEECEYVQVDEFTQREEKRYRVLDLAGAKGSYRQRVFKVEDGKDVLLSEATPLMKGKPLDYVPFTFLSTDDTTAEVDEPPLIDLVNLNLSHYRTTADLEHGAHFAGLPTAWISGYKPSDPSEKLYIGSAAAWTFDDPNAKAAFLEFTGQGLQALEKRIEVKEKQMAVLGARMLEPQKAAVEKPEAMAQSRKGEESALSMTSQSISLGLRRALQWFSDWAGGTADVEVELNRDFYPQTMTPQMLQALVSSWQAGAFSQQVLFDKLQQAEVIGADVTLEEEQQRIQDEGPKIGVAAPPGQPGAGNVTPFKPPRTRKVTNDKTGDSYTIQEG